MIKKNEEYIVNVIDNGFQGEGIAKIEDFAIFIKDAIKGEKLKIKILKVNSSFAYAKIIDIIEKSEHRKEQDCATYSKCGGCSLRNMDYDYTCEIKLNSAKSTLRKALRRDINISSIIKMDEPFYYRNKLQYPVGLNNEGHPAIGVYAERSHNIIETSNCLIQNKLCQEISNYIFELIKYYNISVYDEEGLKGSIRHIYIRIGIHTNEVMVVLVSNTRKIEHEEELVNKLIEKYPQIRTVIKNINSQNTNVILGKENIVLYGDGFIFDTINDFKFKISPFSFFQVNPIQTEKLYNKAIDFASLNENSVIFDLYCGIGTIGICASKKVKKIYGIETVKEAIADANENAKLNNIENAEFMVGNVEEVLPKFVKENNIVPDCIFIDPPRKGCEKVVLDTLLNVKSQKIVYVSCNPATLARDLKVLEEKYEIKDIACVDMFPWTSHVETVCMLKRSNDNE